MSAAGAREEEEASRFVAGRGNRGSETFCGAALWGKESGKGSATAARATAGFWTVSAACGKIPLDFFSPSRGHGPFLDCSTAPGPVILDRKSFQKIKSWIGSEQEGN